MSTEFRSRFKFITIYDGFKMYQQSSDAEPEHNIFVVKAVGIILTRLRLVPVPLDGKLVVCSVAEPKLF